MNAKLQELSLEKCIIGESCMNSKICLLVARVYVVCMN